MIGFNTNIFETNVLNLRVVVGIVTTGLVDVLRDTLNQRRLTIRNTKLEVLEKTYELQLEVESFWIVERYVVEECDFIRRSVKRDVDAEKCRQIADEETQKNLYQKRYDETLLNKVNQIERFIRQKAFTSAINLAKKTLKEELQRVEKQQKLNEELLTILGVWVYQQVWNDN
jgi:F0F1-type ATP synthase membrane subunit b/b'